MNLYLYIPAESAHPPGMILGVINSLVIRFHNQNTHQKDFIQAIKLLFRRLIAWGWDPTMIKSTIVTAVSKASNKASNKKNSAPTKWPI